MAISDEDFARLVAQVDATGPRKKLPPPLARVLREGIELARANERREAAESAAHEGAKRAKETDDERRERLAKARQRYNARMASETPAERRARLVLQAQRMHNRRAIETIPQLEQRGRSAPRTWPSDGPTKRQRSAPPASPKCERMPSADTMRSASQSHRTYSQTSRSCDTPGKHSYGLGVLKGEEYDRVRIYPVTRRPSTMQRTLISTPEDMKWLADVHGIIAVTAILCGNEDCPDRVEAFDTECPMITDTPTVYARNAETGALVRE